MSRNLALRIALIGAKGPGSARASSAAKARHVSPDVVGRKRHVNGTAPQRDINGGFPRGGEEPLTMAAYVAGMGDGQGAPRSICSIGQMPGGGYTTLVWSATSVPKSTKRHRPVACHARCQAAAPPRTAGRRAG